MKDQGRRPNLGGSVGGVAVRIAMAGLVAALAGCARYQEVNVRSQPAGAEVFVDGERVGRTPLRIRVDRDKDHLVFLKLEGYVPERQVLKLNQAPDDVDFLTPADVELALGRAPSGPGATSDERGVEVELEKEE